MSWAANSLHPFCFLLCFRFLFLIKSQTSHHWVFVRIKTLRDPCSPTWCYTLHCWLMFAFSLFVLKHTPV
jgi:hypothetical protein